MQLPGKNILVLAAVCLSILGGVGAYKIAQGARANLEQRGGIAANIATTTETDKNSQLLNALQQAELEPIVSDSNNPFVLSKDDTLTTSLSKSFFTSYTQIQASGDSGTIDDQDAINSALSKVDLSTMPRDKYTASDITVIAGNLPSELKSYANNFVLIQNTGLVKISNNPEKYENNLNAIGEIYASIGANLLTIKVPVSLASEHLSIANAFYVSSEDFKLISDQNKDPLKSLLGLRQYKDTVEKQRQMYTDISAYLERNGILFSETEPGYFWTSFSATTSASTQ